MSGKSSAQVWREVAARQRQYGNAVGQMENLSGNECLLGSMKHLDVSRGEQRRAEKEFEKVVGYWPSEFNDFHSGSSENTLAAAERVADALEGRAAGPAAVGRARTRAALPAGQSWLMDSSWVRSPERAEASR